MNALLAQNLNLLWHEEQNVREQAEKCLNEHFSKIEATKDAFAYIYNAAAADVNQRLKLMIYIKNFIKKMYDFSLRHIQIEIQLFIYHNYFKNAGPPLFDSYCIELVAFLIVKDFPESRLLEEILRQSQLEKNDYLVLTQVFKELEIYRVKLLQLYTKIFELVNMSFPQELQNQTVSLTYIPQLLMQVINWKFEDDRLMKSLFWHLRQLIGANMLYTETNFYYLKCHCRYLKYYISCVDSALLQQLFMLINQYYVPRLINTGLQNEMWYQRVNYQVFKLLNLLIWYLSNQELQGCWENIMQFIICNGALTDSQYYSELLQNENELETANFNVSLRQKATELLKSLCQGYEEEIILNYITKQIETLHKNLLIEIELQQVKMNTIQEMESLLYCLSNLFFLNFTICLNNQFIEVLLSHFKFASEDFIPIKIQILGIINKSMKQHNLSLEFQAAFTQNWISLLQAHNNPLYQLQLLKSAVIMIKNSVEIKNYFLNKDVFNLQQLLFCYNNTHSIQVKLDILSILIQLKQENATIIQILEAEWTQSIDSHSKYKPKIDLVLKVINIIAHEWDLPDWSPYASLFLGLIDQAFKRDCNEQLCLEALQSLLNKFVTEGIVNFTPHTTLIMQDLFAHIISHDQENFKQLILIEFMMLGICDDKLLINYIKVNQVLLMRTRQLAFVSIFMHLMSFELVEEIFKPFLRNQYHQNNSQRIFDHGITYSEMATWMAILNQRGIEVKQLIVNLQENSEYKGFFKIMLQKAYERVKTQSGYQFNYYQRFLIALKQETNIEFDLKTLSLESTIKNQIDSQLQTFRNRRCNESLCSYLTQHYRKSSYIKFIPHQIIEARFQAQIPPYETNEQDDLINQFSQL